MHGGCLDECVAQTANVVALSLDYALELEDRLREADAMRSELREVKAELAETKAAAAPRESMGRLGRSKARAN